LKVIRVEPTAPALPKRKRTAGYARVSSGKEAMLHSLSAQVSYYSELIAQRPDWEYRGVFVDEAISGTKDNRPGFQAMLDECRAGNIDLVITKSLSRLARNTVTILQSIRELKALGVDIFFESENIHSLSAEGELMLTILSSYAQEQSRQCSENVKWRVRKQFREGRVTGMTMLGYHLVDGVLTIIPEEAEVVQQIFSDYLSGMGLVAIAKKLRKQGVKMSASGLHGLLRNEKYQGDMLLQKGYVPNHLTKKKVKNIGQLPQFYVRDSHEAIIDKDTFAAVQAEIARRAAAHQPKAPPEPSYPFTGLIRCGKCDRPYKRKHANAGSKYEKIVWICPTFNEMGKEECDSQQIPEDILQNKVAEILGMPFSEISLRTFISEILVPGPGQLTFVFADGHRVDVAWEHQSRRQSWTPEMKEAARQKALEQHRKKEAQNA
jgi:DNA invertase Pin-like site-specific DNA recombinase